MWLDDVSIIFLHKMEILRFESDRITHVAIDWLAPMCRASMRFYLKSNNDLSIKNALDEQILLDIEVAQKWHCEKMER